MFLILNEHSIPFDGNDAQSREILEKFIETFAHILKYYGGKIDECLHTVQDFKTIMLNPKYGFNVWRNQPVDKDLLRKFISICDRQKIINTALNNELEVRYCDYRDGSLQFAYENDGALLSFATSQVWKLSELEVTVDFIDDFDPKLWWLKNFYDKSITDNNEWLDKLPTTTFTEMYPNIESLCSNLTKALPNLIFHSKAEKQLKNDVKLSWYFPLANRLHELNEACLNMNDKNFDKSNFAPRTISAESSETIEKYKKKYSFTYEGKDYTVKYHLRYTGDGNSQGRVYFVPIIGNKCIVYSLTSKLPTVSYPKASV